MVPGFGPGGCLSLYDQERLTAMRTINGASKIIKRRLAPAIAGGLRGYKDNGITDTSLRDNSTVSHGVPIMLLSALAIKVARLLNTPDRRYYLYDK